MQLGDAFSDVVMMTAIGLASDPRGHKAAGT
jgi:hypothetical protein